VELAAVEVLGVVDGTGRERQSAGYAFEALMAWAVTLSRRVRYSLAVIRPATSSESSRRNSSCQVNVVLLR